MLMYLYVQTDTQIIFLILSMLAHELRRLVLLVSAILSRCRISSSKRSALCLWVSLLYSSPSLHQKVKYICNAPDAFRSPSQEGSWIFSTFKDYFWHILVSNNFLFQLQSFLFYLCAPVGKRNIHLLFIWNCYLTANDLLNELMIITIPTEMFMPVAIQSFNIFPLNTAKEIRKTFFITSGTISNITRLFLSLPKIIHFKISFISSAFNGFLLSGKTQFCFTYSISIHCICCFHFHVLHFSNLTYCYVIA